MGFITSLTLNNDLLSDLKRDDSRLGPELYNAVLSVDFPEAGRSKVSAAGIQVVESHHADYAQPILVGGGREATVIGGVSIFYTVPDPELELLRQLARKHGFDLRKKRSR